MAVIYAGEEMIAAPFGKQSGVFVEIEGEQWELIREHLPPKFNTIEQAMKYPEEMAKNTSYEEYLKLSVCPWVEKYLPDLHVENVEYINAPFVINTAYHEESKRFRNLVLKSPKSEDVQTVYCL